MKQVQPNAENPNSSIKKINPNQSNNNSSSKIHNSYSQSPKSKSKQQFQCPICYLSTTSYGIICKSNHKVCEACLKDLIEISLKSYKKIQCPYENCQYYLQENSQCYKKLTQEQQYQFQKIKTHFKILSNKKLKPCQKVSCYGWYNTQQKQQKCTICNQQHCKKCNQILHPGICEARIAMNLELGKKYRQCKQCKQIIQKSEGCTHMTCTCGHYFCYMCGQTLIDHHQCKVPEQLNCIQKIRWDVEHEQLWYESSMINFLRFLTMMQPDQDKSPATKAIIVLLYTIFVYPLTIAASLLAAILLFIALLVILTIFIILLPFMNLCDGNGFNLFPTYQISNCCGCCVAFIVVVLLYPLLLVMNFIQFFCGLICEDDIDLRQICQAISQIIKGVFNTCCIPCMMSVSNQQFYEQQKAKEEFKIAESPVQIQDLLQVQQLVD